MGKTDPNKNKESSTSSSTNETNNEGNGTKSTYNNSDSNKTNASSVILLKNSKTMKRTNEGKNREVKKDNDIFIGGGNNSYVRTTDCKNNCTGRGMCLNHTCFCNQGYKYFDFRIWF